MIIYIIMANKSKSLSFPLRNSREVDARPSFKLTCKRKVHKSIDHVLPVLMFCHFSCFGSSHTGFKTWILILV